MADNQSCRCHVLCQGRRELKVPAGTAMNCCTSLLLTIHSIAIVSVHCSNSIMPFRTEAHPAPQHACCCHACKTLLPPLFDALWCLLCDYICSVLGPLAKIVTYCTCKPFGSVVVDPAGTRFRGVYSPAPFCITSCVYPFDDNASANSVVSTALIKASNFVVPTVTNTVFCT
eukprot:GHRR01028982.1.p1 GENE.GHRR01028982.1~~GHRR01028982.1.p1  ORF type:complete len:172 (-),score=7.76 GHRR01028982.1:1175-1690(-)